MDSYSQPLQSVDDALRRLNATLAAYKLSNGNAKDAPPKAADTEDEVRNGTVAVEPAQSVGEQNDDVHWQEMLRLRAGQVLPEVCTFNMKRHELSRRDELIRFSSTLS